MKFTSQEEYGLRCLLRLAREGENATLTIPEISQAEGLSTAHVAKLMRLLRQAGFVTSERGQAGGYSLAHAPEKIAVGEVLAALGGRLYDPDFCEKFTGTESLCTHTVDCSIRSLWATVQGAVDHVLGKTTLKTMIKGEKEMAGWSRQVVRDLKVYPR